jgi:hypothetical protein
VHHRSNGTATSTRVLESHSALTGRGSRPCNQALCVWQAPPPFKITGTGDRFRFDGERVALRKRALCVWKN